MRSIVFMLIGLLLIAPAVFAQSDRGVITGAVTDPAGGMIPNVPIEAKNTGTGIVYKTASTATGNYTLPQLPVGPYQITASVAGFKQYIRTGITVVAAQTIRVDIPMEVGSISETVNVSAEAPLLKTESGEMSHNISSNTLNDLPVLSMSFGMRSMYNLVQLLPSATQQGGTRVNGTPGNTMTLRVEGQDATQTVWTSASGMSQPSVDSVEEFAVQTSNYAAEYGQAGSSVFNVTMRSGTNKLHGSAYLYLRNEALNAQTPYYNSKNRDRRYDFGFTAGGPVYLPHIYDGRDKTFFFFSYEWYRFNSIVNNTYGTVPTEAYRAGDFSSIFTGRTLGTDVLGRTIKEGTIYDPRTTRNEVVNGVTYSVRDPFENNQVPSSLFDPVSKNIQDMIPHSTLSQKTQNYLRPPYSTYNYDSIPSIKIDHSLSPNIKISGYWMLNDQVVPLKDAFDNEISTERILWETTHTARFSYDQTISPTLMFHFGAGLMTFYFDSPPPNTKFNSLTELGLPNTYATIFPTIWGLNDAQGGMGSPWGQNNMGAVAHGTFDNQKVTSVANLTWARANHTIKMGAEMKLDGYPATIYTPGNGWYYFANNQTALPYVQDYIVKDPITGTSGSVGFPYASFLLGMVNQGEIGIVSRFHMGKSAWGVFVQDSWKVTRKFTLDYGLRWDYQTYLKETYGRTKNFSPTTPNPSYGNIMGASVFEGGPNGAPFANNYPYAIGPRLGAAYQITPKTVLRAGWGISYGQTASLEMESLRFGSDDAYGAPSFGVPATFLKDGAPKVPVWPNYDPGQLPVNTGDVFTTAIDRESGRPPRLMMWSIGIQREIRKDLSMEVSYVGNRGVWWTAASLDDINRITPAILAAHNLDLNNAAHRTLLTTNIGDVTPADAAAHGIALPYDSFPLKSSVAQSLRPFPHFGGIRMLWAPRGNSWYDALQVRLTKRYSHGLDMQASYTFQKELTIGAETQDPAFFVVSPQVNDLNNLKSNKYISGYSTPHRLVISGNYTVPKPGWNKFVNFVLQDWQIGAVLQYQSGRPIRVPAAQSGLASLLMLCSPVAVTGGCNGASSGMGAASFANRVAGQPLYASGIEDLNDKYDINKQFLLNPAAWQDPAPGQFGMSAAYYSDYRYARVPSEAMSLGRLFRLREGMTLQIRAEFTNIFNRNLPINPTSSNAQAPQLTLPNGTPFAGFGYAPWYMAGGARSGQLVARWIF